MFSPLAMRSGFVDSCWGNIPQIVSHVYGECLITCIALFGVITRTTSPGISSYKRQESIDLVDEVFIIGPILVYKFVNKFVICKHNLEQNIFFDIENLQIGVHFCWLIEFPTFHTPFHSVTTMVDVT